MRPPIGVWLFMSLNASRVQRNVPVRLTSTTRCHCSTVSSSIGIPGALAPALLNRKSSRPNASFVRAKSASTDAGSLTSAGTASARSPSAPASAFVFSERLGAASREHHRPSLAQHRQRASFRFRSFPPSARPTPVPAPVIIAIPAVAFRVRSFSEHPSSARSVSTLRFRATGPAGRKRPESSRRTPGNAISPRRPGVHRACTLFRADSLHARREDCCPSAMRAALAPLPRPGCPTMMDPIRYPIRTTVTALVIAAAAAYPGEAAEQDCAPGEVHADVDGRPLTPEEKIARMDQALRESLARFDECQAAASVSADGGSGVEGAQGNAAGGGGSDGSVAGEGGDDGTAQADGTVESVAAEGVQGTEAPEEAGATVQGGDDGTAQADGAVESVAAEGVQGTEAPEEAGATVAGSEQPTSSGGVPVRHSATSPTTSPSPTTTASSKPRSAGRRWRRPTRGSGPSSGTSTASTRACPRGRSPTTTENLPMRRIPSSFILAAALAMLAGCATTGTTTGPSVGPRAHPSAGTPDAAYQGVRLDVIVPVFDPGLPADPDDYEKEGVWPELRRAEANRFAVTLKRALQDTLAFGDVRVSPDTEATGDLYVIGAIEKSDGQDVVIAVEAVDIGGKRWMRKRYRHRVKEHFWRDPRNAGLDPYQPVFDEAAADVAKLVGKRSARELTELRHLAEIRFAKSFSEDAFAEHVDERGGRATLIALPDPDDPMLARTPRHPGARGAVPGQHADALRRLRPAHRRELRRLAGAQPDRGQGEERSPGQGPGAGGAGRGAGGGRRIRRDQGQPGLQPGSGSGRGRRRHRRRRAHREELPEQLRGQGPRRSAVGARRVARRRGRIPVVESRARPRAPATRASSSGSGGRSWRIRHRGGEDSLSLPWSENHPVVAQGRL